MFKNKKGPRASLTPRFITQPNHDLPAFTGTTLNMGEKDKPEFGLNLLPNNVQDNPNR